MTSTPIRIVACIWFLTFGITSCDVCLASQDKVAIFTSPDPLVMSPLQQALDQIERRAVFSDIEVDYLPEKHDPIQLQKAMSNNRVARAVTLQLSNRTVIIHSLCPTDAPCSPRPKEDPLHIKIEQLTGSLLEENLLSRLSGDTQPAFNWTTPDMEDIKKISEKPAPLTRPSAPTPPVSQPRSLWSKPWIWIPIGLLAGAGMYAGVKYVQHQNEPSGHVRIASVTP